MAARMSVVERHAWLRPMTTGEAIDLALRCYQRSAWSLLRLTAFPMALAFSGIVFMALVVVPGLMTTSSLGSVRTEGGELFVSLVLGFAIGLPLVFTGIGSVLGTVTKATSDTLDGRPVDEAASLEAGRRSLKAVFGGIVRVFFVGCVFFLLAGGFAVIGILSERAIGMQAAGGIAAAMAALSVFAGVVFAPLWMNTRALMPAVVVLEGVGPKEAGKRSAYLMKRHRGQGSADGVTFGVFLLLLFLGAVLTTSLLVLVQLTGISGRIESWVSVAGVAQLAGQLVSYLPGYVCLWLLVPFWGTAMTVLYFDRRVRIEALDVQVMTDDINNADRRALLLR